MHLEKWLHGKIRNEAQRNAALARLLPADGDEPLSRRAVEDYQLIMLRRILQYASDGSAYYRDLFRQAAVNPSGVRRLEDLSSFPFTEPSRLAKSPYRFLCLSQSEVARACTFITSGTTGPQKQVFWTQGDLDRIVDFMSAGIGVAANPGDSVLIILPDGRPNSQADLLYRGVQKLGAMPMVSEFDSSAEEFWQIIMEFRPDVIFGYAGRLFRLTKELQQKHDPGAAGIRILFLAAEYLPYARRRELQDIWGCRVHTHYGLTEMGLGVAVECSSQCGYHFNEADLLLEIVDPETGKAVQPGTEGELVFTTLTREAAPLIRFRTHDVSRLIMEPCACGALSLLKFDAVKKRLESIVKTSNGERLYPSLFDDILFEIPNLVDYQAVLEKCENEERLSVRVEMAGQGEDFAAEIVRRLLSAPAISRSVACGAMGPPRVQVVSPGALKSESRAKKLIVDRR